MRRADQLWLFDSTQNTLTDVTRTLGNGSAPITLNQNDKLYVAHSDWLSGLLLFLPSQTAPPDIQPEVYSGISEDWQPLPVQERVDQRSIGSAVVATGFDYLTSGVVTWNVSPYLWTERVAGLGFPELTMPPNQYSGFWVRLVNEGTTPFTIQRLLPSLFNTYATHQDVANFLAVPYFKDDSDPSAAFVRERIRVHEDWLDDYTRRAWRPRMVLNEQSYLNIHGLTLRRDPVLLVSRAVLWNYQTQTALVEGRSQDFFVSQDTNSVQFNSVSLGMLPIQGRLTSAYFRQQAPFEVDYVYGEDFDVSEKSFIVRDIILRKTAADIVEMSDYAPILTHNPEFGKPDKLKSYLDRAQDAATNLRRIVMY